MCVWVSLHQMMSREVVQFLVNLSIVLSYEVMIKGINLVRVHYKRKDGIHM